MQEIIQDAELQKLVDLIDSTYSPLTQECKLDLLHCAKVYSVKKSTLIVKETQYADKMYFIVQGCFRVFYLKDGKDITDWFGFEHEFVCAINSFFLSIPSPHYIEAIESTLYIEIAREDIFKLTEKHHCFETLARIATTKTMLQLQSRIVALQFENAFQKYENLVQSRPDITQRIPLMHIASYLGITLETLSRIRNPKNRI